MFIYNKLIYCSNGDGSVVTLQKIHHSINTLFFTILILLFLTTPALAAWIDGTVMYENSGDPASGITVVAKIDDVVKGSDETNDDGYYKITGLPGNTEYDIYTDVGGSAGVVNVQGNTNFDFTIASTPIPEFSSLIIPISIVLILGLIFIRRENNA